MSDNRKYYYLKLKENFYNSETMVILESMQDGLLYSNLLLKMYLMSLKSGGILMLNDHLPHTPQTIATFTRHQVGTVERALKVFLEFGLVEILTDGAYYMTDIQLLIGQSSTEGERKKKERMRLKRQKLLPSGGADICPPYSQGDICPPEIRDKRLDIRDKSIENRESESAHAYGRYQNVFLTDGELADLQASFPTVWGQYIEKLSEYMASTGKRYQSHAATIRRWAGEDAKKAAPPTRNRDYSVKEDETQETKVRASKKLAGLICHSSANFTEIKSVVTSLLQNLGYSMEISDSNNPSFIAGRVSDVKGTSANGNISGFFGEFSPEVITNFTLDYPVIGFEIEFNPQK